MCEISAEHVNDNMAEFSRLWFVEEHPGVVGETALKHYVEVAPDTQLAQKINGVFEDQSQV